MTPETRPCRCGKGTIIVEFEMDDWKRCREWEVIKCPVCLAEQNKFEKEQAAIEAKQEAALRSAKRLGKERYLKSWLLSFEGLSKKAVWARLTENGKYYPALGTFYSHLKSYPTTKAYLMRCFTEDFVNTFKRSGIKDSEIIALLEQADES